jgi:hypothetical protein
MALPSSLRRSVLALLLCVAGAAVIRPIAHADQGAMNLRATWADLERWSREVSSVDTEVGLGLQPAGPAGTMLVAFTARVHRLGRVEPPTEIVVQVAGPPMANQNMLRTMTLSFELDVDKPAPHRVAIDLSSRLSVDNPWPGAHPDNGIATMKAAEFAQVIAADAVKMYVFGVKVTLRPEQRQALKAFSDRINGRPGR